MSGYTDKAITADGASRLGRCVFLLALAILVLSFGAPARAQLSIDITRGSLEPTAIAVMDFYGVTPEAEQFGQDIAEVVAADLERSGLFRPIDPRAFIQSPEEVRTNLRFADWKQINAQALIVGEVEIQGDGRVKAEFRLWDVFAEEHMLGMVFATAPDLWRRVAHKIADAVYERLTGESGYFDTRMVYVAETGPANKRVKRLAIMDQDGANLRYLTDGEHLVLTPRFSAGAQEISYLLYLHGEPRVYLLNIDTGQQEVLGNFPGMTFAPRFSPDGNKVLLTFAEGGNSEIYKMDLHTRQIERLTYNPAIDTAPSYAPDGTRIVFESDRGGSQQIYVMGAEGGDARRISFGKGRYGTPVWSPRGDLIAFTKSHKGRFYIGVMDPEGEDERLLTQGFLVEGPSWAPNGRVLVFFRQNIGQGERQTELVTIDLTGYNERTLITPTEASDPAWSPLIP
jgi:TolB protein